MVFKFLSLSPVKADRLKCRNHVDDIVASYGLMALVVGIVVTTIGQPWRMKRKMAALTTEEYYSGGRNES